MLEERTTLTFKSLNEQMENTGELTCTSPKECILRTNGAVFSDQ